MNLCKNMLIACTVLATVFSVIMIVEASSTTDHEPYDFKYLIGDIVAWDGEWWEVSARVEARHCKDENIYPWYYLERPNAGKLEYIWVWAKPIDNIAESQRLSGTRETQSCCPNPPPDCPTPPCFKDPNP